MNADPRIEGLGDNYPTGVATQMRMEAEGWIKTFDERDATAGVVRVDTRDPATIQRIADAIGNNPVDMPPGCTCDDCEQSRARAVLAVLAGESDAS